MTDSSKRALVTGGSAGLGLHVARMLAERGYLVTIAGRRAERLDAAVQDFPGNGHQYISVDLSSEVGVSDLVGLIEHEPFDVLVNNAGAAVFGPLRSMSSDLLIGQLWLNFMAPACLSQAFVKTAPAGSVLANVTSIVGRIPMPGAAAYSAAKSALQTITECLWYESLRNNIAVLDFRPVSIHTDFHDAAGVRALSVQIARASPERAARSLVNAIEKRSRLIRRFGAGSSLLELVNRVLPRKALIRLMGAKSRKTGYL